MLGGQDAGPQPDSMITYGKLHDPVIPPSLAQELSRIGGRHPLYDVPLFRLIWGQKRLHWVGGKFENDVDSGGNRIPVHVATRLEPRYLGASGERWILERWIPNDCDRDTWYRRNEKWIDGIRVDQLGPYPEFGDYEEVISMPPEVLTNPDFYHYVIKAIQMTQDISRSVRRSHLLSKPEEEDAKWREEAEQIMSDTPRSYLRPSIVVPTSYTRSL